MEVDANELLHRIGAVLRGISDKMDRLIEIGASLEGQVRLPSEKELKTVADVLRNDTCISSDAVAEEPPKKWRILHPGESVRASDWENEDLNSETDPPDGPGWRPASMWKNGRSVLRDDKCIYARLVVDEPAKEPEPEHPAGPKPEPGEGYRILSKDPPEDLSPGDEYFGRWDGLWSESMRAGWGYKRQDPDCWYRRKIETAKPAWEPKVGDWVKVTRPQNWKEWKDPLWREEMHIYDGRVFELVKWSQFSTGRRASLQGIDWFFHRDWLSPAEPPEPEYREPVLPADAGEQCEFSRDGKEWCKFLLAGWQVDNNPWICERYHCWPYARIKKDA